MTILKTASLVRGHDARQRAGGFTLIEIMIVITIIGILISIAIPNYRQSIIRAREAVFRQNLAVLRSSIQQFTLDKERPPDSLEELVSEGYLNVVPPDITGSSSSWQVEYSEELVSPEQSEPGISSVRSGSTETASDGTPYSSW